MELKHLEDLIGLVQKRGEIRTCAIPAADDLHVLEAVLTAKREKILEPILIGSRAKLLKLADELRENVEGIRIVDIDDVIRATHMAVELVKAGEASFLMKGQLNTADLLRAMLDKEHGLPHDKVVTNLTLLELPFYHKLLAVNDGALIPHSTLEQKMSRINTIAAALRKLGYDREIKVAAMAANEEISPKILETVEAAKLKEMNRAGAFPGCIVEGPISVDLALSPAAAERKGYKSPVAGDADLLLFPDLLSANVFNKLSEFMDTVPSGVLLGTSAPVAITSRSATTKSKLCSLALAAMIAE